MHPDHPHGSPDLSDLDPGDPRWSAALAVLQELRPHLTADLLDQVLTEARPQGLRYTAAFVEERCVAVAGWRVMANTSAIRTFHIDDLATSTAERSRGYGAMLLAALTERARDLGCTRIELDSGVQRHQAHRFYLRQGMDIVSHHFRRTLS